MDRDQALALLREQHDFPGEYTFRVVVRPPARSGAVSAVAATIGGDHAVLDITERPSRKGTYVALHLRVTVRDAEQILDVYQVLGGVDGVLTSM